MPAGSCCIELVGFGELSHELLPVKFPVRTRRNRIRVSFFAQSTRTLCVAGGKLALTQSQESNSKPIDGPRPPQTPAASFKSLYRTRAGQSICHSRVVCSRRASDTALRLSRPNRIAPRKGPKAHCGRIGPGATRRPGGGSRCGQLELRGGKIRLAAMDGLRRSIRGTSRLSRFVLHSRGRSTADRYWPGIAGIRTRLA